jgi:hypothetical protein
MVILLKKYNLHFFDLLSNNNDKITYWFISTKKNKNLLSQNLKFKLIIFIQ